MIECSMRGCKEILSRFSIWHPFRNYETYASHWVIFRACQCGAYDGRNMKSCECPSHPESAVKITYWPNLDWWILGGVEEVVLCPQHRQEVLEEIILQRANDPSMNPQGRMPHNKH